MPDNKAVAECAIVSPERVGEVIRVQMRIARAKGLTLADIARDSGVRLNTIRGWIEEGKEPSLSKALSVAVVLGERAVNAVLAIIGYGGACPLDEPGRVNPMRLVADCMEPFSVLARAAADGRIDHTEEEPCREAADTIIATVLPLSSAGQAE